MAGETQQPQGDLLRESLNYIASRGTEMAQTFYRNLFKSNADIKELFARVDISAQHEMFLAALQYIVMNYENRAALLRTLRELGARHARYGVRPEYFAVFGECMLRTMAQISGRRWSLPIELAWRTAFENVAEIMIEGAADDKR